MNNSSRKNPLEGIGLPSDSNLLVFYHEQFTTKQVDSETPPLPKVKPVIDKTTETVPPKTKADK